MRPLDFSCEREAPWERWLAWAVLAAFAVLALLEVTRFRPGFSRFDETLAMDYLQQWREGSPLGFELFKGCISRRLDALALLLCGPSLLALHAVAWLGLALEAWLLWRLGAAWLGRRAAFWALIFLACNATSFLRARSLLSFTWFPAELLLLGLLSSLARSRAASVFFGLLAGLMLTDYEGLALALPILGLLFCWAGPGRRPRLLWAALGLGLAVAWLAGASPELDRQYLLRRGFELSGLHAGAAMRGLWSGLFSGTEDPWRYLAVAGHGFLPLYALPLAVAGLVKLGRNALVLLGWAALGLIPVLMPGTESEPNRLLAALPALCLLSGAGACLILDQLGLLALPAAVAALALLGSLEGRQYIRSMGSPAAEKEYAESRAWMDAARRLPGRRLLSEIGSGSGAAARLVWDAEGAAGPRPLLLLRSEYAPGLRGQQAQVHQQALPGDLAPYLWVEGMQPVFQDKVVHDDDELRALRAALPRFSLPARRDGLLRYAASNPGPFAQTAALEEALTLSDTLHDLPPLVVRLALKAPLVSAAAPGTLSGMARGQGDPADASRLCLRAHAIDARWSCP